MEVKLAQPPKNRTRPKKLGRGWIHKLVPIPQKNGGQGGVKSTPAIRICERLLSGVGPLRRRRDCKWASTLLCRISPLPLFARSQASLPVSGGRIRKPTQKLSRLSPVWPSPSLCSERDGAAISLGSICLNLLVGLRNFRDSPASDFLFFRMISRQSLELAESVRAGWTKGSGATIPKSSWQPKHGISKNALAS